MSIDIFPREYLISSLRRYLNRTNNHHIKNNGYRKIKISCNNIMLKYLRNDYVSNGPETFGMVSCWLCM